MYGNGAEPFKSPRARRDSAFTQEYRNRLREIRDLLYNTEQAGLLIDEWRPDLHARASRRWSTPTAPCGTTTRSWPRAT